MRAGTFRWEPLAVVASYVLIAIALLGVFRIAGSDQLGLTDELARLVMNVGFLIMPAGLVSYALLKSRSDIVWRAGIMALVTAIFTGAVGVLTAGAGILWLAIASRRGVSVTSQGRITYLALWAGAFVVGWLLHDDPMCTSQGSIEVCTSDAVVWWEATLALCMGGGALLLAAATRSPPDPTADLSLTTYGNSDSESLGNSSH